MKTIIKSIVFIIFIFGNSYILASEKQILLLHQKIPGIMLFVSMIDNGENCLVMVGNRSNPMDAKEIFINTNIFKSLWGLGNSKQLQKYQFKPGEIANLANPKFYTISLRNEFGDKIYLQVPVKGLNNKASKFIKSIKFYIAETS